MLWKTFYVVQHILFQLEIRSTACFDLFWRNSWL